MDEAHKARKAELEQQLKDGSTDPNVKTELDAINELEASANEGADAPAQTSKSQEKRENAQKASNR